MICLICRSDFRKEYKAEHPDNKSVSAVAKEGGERWKSMSDEDKKPYLDKAAELKAEYHNGERSDVCSFFLSLAFPPVLPPFFTGQTIDQYCDGRRTMLVATQASRR